MKISKVLSLFTIVLMLCTSSVSHAASNIQWTQQARSIITSFQSTDYNGVGSSSAGTAFLQLISTVRTRQLGNISGSMLYGLANGDQVALDPDGEQTRQCVTLVKILTNTAGYSAGGSWQKGSQIVPNMNISMGTAVATFNGPGGSYGGHTGILMEVTSSYMLILDQNWVENDLYSPYTGNIGVHRIYFTGTGNTSDAGSYYVVQLWWSERKIREQGRSLFTFIN